MSVSISIDRVTKKFGEATVIPELSLKIENSEFFTLLGPSGCGKTTLLRMIAGFNTIEAGTISFDDQVINAMPTHKRNIGMVFQSYAIFPHLTVRGNVEYGMRIRKTPKAEMDARVDEMMKVVHIHEYQDRLPERLSGGQQQRVALARAIVIHPNVLLMDEPLSNLDAKLRVEMRSVIRDIQKHVGITTVYVTHDQEEALTVSDRIAVMNSGVIHQIGRPQDIYARPADVFVATFIGHSNLFHAKIKADGTKRAVVFRSGYALEMETLVPDAADGADVVVAVRPEEFLHADRGLDCSITASVFLGRSTNYCVDFGEGMCVDGQPSIEFSEDLGRAERLHSVGDKLTLKPNPAKINVYTADMTKSLIKGVARHGEE